MKEYEFNSYSVGDSLIFEMHEELRIRNLLENAQNVEDYKSFISVEKTHTVQINNLTIGNIYFPIGLQAVPVGEIILLKYSEHPAEYVDNKNGKFYFNSQNKIIDFPLSRDIGDGFLETLIYSSQIDQRQFMSVLGLRFSSWTIKPKKV
jgi:hypothetical protein